MDTRTKKETLNHLVLVYLNTFSLLVEHSIIVIQQMFTFYPLLRFESGWTLMFRSLQVINALYAAWQVILPFRQQSPVGGPWSRNPVLKEPPIDTLRLT